MTKIWHQLFHRIWKCFDSRLQLILIIFIIYYCSADYKNRFGDKDQYSFIEELFGTGLTNEEISKESKRHISSSTEDLKFLLKDEKKLLNIMKQDKDQSMFLSYIEEIGLLDTIERYLSKIQLNN